MRIVCAVVAVVVLAGCGGSPDDGRLDVVASFYPLAFAAERIGGDAVSVTNLTPPGAEPHDVELTPQDIAELQRADLVLYVGGGFQPAVERALDGARGRKLDLLHELRAEGSHDAHFWVDPPLLGLAALAIGEELGDVEAGNALADELGELHRDYERGLARCERRAFVTSHAAFGFLASDYGLEEIPIGGREPEDEPSADTIVDLAERIRREGLTTVFHEPLVSPNAAETLAREAGVETAVLDPIEGLTDEEADRGEDYFSLMRRNLAALRKALGCR